MKKFSLILLLVGFVMSACSVNRPQESSKPEATPDSEEVKVVIEDLPTFQGGDIKDFEAWVQDHVTYPRISS